MAISLDALVLHVIISTIIIGPVLWLAGRALVGKQKAKFTDGLWIAALGTIIGEVFNYFFSGVIASIVMIIVWLWLIRHFFDCGWVKALVIAVAAIIIFIVIAAVLALIGFVVLAPYLPRFGV